MHIVSYKKCCMQLSLANFYCQPKCNAKGMKEINYRCSIHFNCSPYVLYVHIPTFIHLYSQSNTNIKCKGECSLIIVRDKSSFKINFSDTLTYANVYTVQCSAHSM